MESQLLKSSKIFVIFFQNAVSFDEMGEFWKIENWRLKIETTNLLFNDNEWHELTQILFNGTQRHEETKIYDTEQKTQSCPVQNLCVFTTWGVT